MNFLIRPFLPKDGNLSDPNARARVGQRSGLLGIFANVLLFAGKLAVGTLSGSVAITADAMNNLSDASSAIVTVLGFRLAQTPPDEDHPYGHARFEYLSGLAVAMLILLIGVELAKSSAQKILNPAPVEFTYITAGVLIASIAVKLGLSFINGSLANLIDSSALRATAADSRNDCVATGAVLLSGVIAAVTGVDLDGFMGLGVAVFILLSGWNMAKETISPLLGENGSPELRRIIVDCVRAVPLVLGYHDLMVHDYGPGQRFASIHVEMDMREDPLLCHTIIDNIERKCLAEHGVHLVIHYDPVVTDDTELNAMRALVSAALTEIDPTLSFHDFRMVRGTTHTNLIFDVALPMSFTGREKEIRKRLEQAINEKSVTRYYLVITFDSAAFNEQELRS